MLLRSGKILSKTQTNNRPLKIDKYYRTVKDISYLYNDIDYIYKAHIDNTYQVNHNKNKLVFQKFSYIQKELMDKINPNQPINLDKQSKYMLVLFSLFETNIGVKVLRDNHKYRDVVYTKFMAIATRPSYPEKTQFEPKYMDAFKTIFISLIDKGIYIKPACMVNLWY